MGGLATVLTAIDPRVKAASPSVGGSGNLYSDLWGLKGSARRQTAQDGLELYKKTVSAQAYWPKITAPILFLGATNDFNSPTELVVKGMDLLPSSTERVLTLAPHLNHRFTTETSAARFLWMEAHLKGNFKFPKQSATSMNLKTKNHIPQFTVEVDRSTPHQIKNVQVFYSLGRDPRIRFWRSAEVLKNKDSYTAECPIFDTKEPLFAFAQITYKIDRILPACSGNKATDLLSISSQYQITLPEHFAMGKTQAT